MVRAVHEIKAAVSHPGPPAGDPAHYSTASANRREVGHARHDGRHDGRDVDLVDRRCAPDRLPGRCYSEAAPTLAERPLGGLQRLAVEKWLIGAYRIAG